MHRCTIKRLVSAANPWLASAIALALPVASAGALAAAPMRSPKQAAQDKPKVTELGVIEVKVRRPGGPVVLPTSVAIDGPFGPGRSILDTPRSVTPISRDLMRAAGVNNLRDIMKLAPNTYSPTDFGAPSLPDIRGQLGEVFEDGLRQQGGNNGFGVPLSFNAVDSINVVKGPPPVVLGTTQRVGGFVDLQLKRPALDAPGGFVELGPGSWNRNQGQLDYSTPITPGKSAVRLSVEDHHDGSYYDYAHHHSQDVFLAYRLKPDTVSELNASVEYYHVNFTDIAGINRPTQNLIDHGLYITGQGVQPNGSTVPGAFAVVSPTGEVRIPRHRVLTDPADRDSVRTWIAHIRYARSLSDDTQYVARTYYQHLERNEIANDSFVEIIKGANTAEHRSELVLDRDVDLFGHSTHQQTDLGVDVRWNRVLGYSQFDTEADLPVDLTGPIGNRRIPLTPEQQAQLVLLRPGVYVSPGAQYPRNGQAAGYLLSDTTDSNSVQGGVFVQHEIRFTPQWSVMAGVRGDEYYVTARDPIPPPGQSAARDSAHHFLKAINGSVTWKPIDAIALYAASGYSQSTSNSIGGGTPLGADNRIDPADFATASTLYEVGIKLAPPQGRWYADLSLFDQTRSLRNRDGSNSGIRTRGLDAQWFYQARHLFASASFSYLDARYDHSASAQDTTQVLDAFNDSRPDIVVGTGVGAPNAAEFPPSTRRLQGLPSVTASALVGYTFDGGLGGTLSGNYTNAFPLDYLATVYVRAQYTLDASVFYRWKQTGTEVRLAMNNLTNQKNWAPVFDGGYFGATDVFPELPFNVMFSVRQSF